MSLYVSDLDGTLLDPQGRLSDVTRAGLMRLLDEGLVFTVASARHVRSIRKILGDLPLRLPVISSNGAFISDMSQAAMSWCRPLPPSWRRPSSDDPPPWPDAVRVDPRAQGDQVFYQAIENHGQRQFIEERVRNADPRLRHTERLQDELLDPAVTFVVIDRQAPLQALQAELVAEFGDQLETHLAEDLYVPGWPWLSIHDRRASKCQAIKILAERYGLAERELVVFGDHVNDVSMFKAAHRGIAVANAIDAVKAAAHAVIGPHTEDSVLRFIEDDWRPR